MPLSSMTGFGRSEGNIHGVTWVCEAKSVNAKGLDVKCRVPNGYERMEADIRTRAQKLFKRGNIGLFLSIAAESRDVSCQLNWSVLDAVIAAIPAIMEKCPAATPPSVDGLLALKGVIEPVHRDAADDVQARIDQGLMDGIDLALDRLRENRLDEGTRLQTVLDQQMTTVRALKTSALDCAQQQTALLAQRIQKGLAALLESSPPLNEERLAQETALLLTKSDVKEELDRLDAHCEAASELLCSHEAVGRKFDFLCQEFNREANTLCSKAIAPELVQVGLELKVVVDQLREQIQNVE